MTALKTNIRLGTGDPRIPASAHIKQHPLQTGTVELDCVLDQMSGSLVSYVLFLAADDCRSIKEDQLEKEFPEEISPIS